MAFKVISANGAALRYSGFLYNDIRVPGGTLAQPCFSATRARYPLPVAQAMNFWAASVFCDPAGIARDQAQSQLEPLQVTAQGAGANPTLSATLDSLGLVTKEAATVASIHMPHFPESKRARFSLNPLEEAPGGP